MYIDSINNDSLPDVKSSWKIVVDSQFQSIYDKCVKYYVESMLNLDFKTIKELDQLYKHHNAIKEKSMDYLRELTNINIPNNFFLEFNSNIEKKLSEQLNDVIYKWNEVSAKNCQV